MPSLGADMRGGRVVEWHVRPGDAVRRGDVVGVVDTDKGAIEMEIWEDAVIDEIVVGPGGHAAVGAVLLRLRPAVPAVEPERPSAGPAPAAPSRVAARPAGGAGRVPGVSPAARTEPAATRASPAARRHARDLGVDLDRVAGSGPGGAVVLADVVRATAERPAAARPEPTPARWPEGEAHATPLARRVAESLGVDPSHVVGHGPGGLVTRADVEAAAAGGAAERARAPSGALAGKRTAGDAMRRAIAAAMARSKREIPHYYLGSRVSMRAATAWLAEQNRGRPPAERLLAVSLYVKAVAMAVEQVPEVNGHWVNGAMRVSRDVHPGVAIALRGGGLVAPAIRDADRLGLDELSASIADLVERARAGRLRSSEMTDATITVSSVGERGVDVLFGVIYPPQVALVGVGRVVERPWAEDGMLGIHPVVDLTLSGDHRASDGHRGGLFLQAVGELLQRPEEL